MKIHKFTGRLVLISIMLLLVTSSFTALTPGGSDEKGFETGESPASRSSSGSNYFGNETPIYELEANSDIKISGIAKWDSSGYTLATGDIDGDGSSDIIIGAYDANSGPSSDRYSAGEVYVVFGASRSSLTKSIDLASSADIVIYGVDEYDHAGETLAAGDINGDGKDDIIIGIPNGDGSANSVGQEDTGEVAVIYGKSQTLFGSEIDLNKGYDTIIYGKNTKDFAGSALAVGNLDKDNYNDLIISADHADGYAGKQPGAGDVYVFYGKNKFSNSLKCANADFTIYGSLWGDSLGASVAAGDINGDGHDDILIGSPHAFTGPERNTTFGGECYAVFGDTRTDQGKDLNLDNRSNADVTIYGADNEDSLGTQVGLADIDADGYYDLIMGAAVADGPNNARKNAGDIYIVRGKETGIGPTVDLSDSSQVDLTIYGADPKDKAGSAMALGDFNGDGVSDMVISSALADGRTNDDPSAGETYIIYGNISMGAGTERDLGTTGPDLVLYSTVENLHAGFAVAIADIDNDGKDDVIIGAPYADVKDGDVKGAGISYVIYGTEVVKRLKNIGFRLDGVENRLQPVCYARAKPYSFVINITDSIGINDIQIVKLVLDPGGIAVELEWTELSNEFVKKNDPDNYIELISTASYSKRLTDKLLELRFSVLFSGSYPDESFHDVELTSNSDGGLKDSDRYQKIYKVENDIDYWGTLDVAGAYQGPLLSGSWIQSNETVSWSGLSVVYEGTTDEFPPNEYFEVSVEDDDGDIWFNRTSSGSKFVVESKGDGTTDFSDFYTLRILSQYDIVKVPPPIQYELKIASPNVTFLDPSPGDDMWFGDPAIECGISITDLSGGDILSNSIQYATSTSGTHGYGIWQNAGIIGDAVTIESKVLATFADGDDNYIKWRAKSAIGTLGDIYSGSKDYKVLVDTTQVHFKGAFPQSHQWSPALKVTCGITINDKWTGVDASTIEYAYSTSGLDLFTNWISAGLIQDKNEISVEAEINYHEGAENYIKWRSDDVIGNGIVISDIFRIKVSTQKPVSTLFLPVNNTELSSPDPELTWSGFDPNDDSIFYDVYMGTDLSRVTDLDDNYLVAESHSTNSLATYGLSENTDYYWTVIPNDGIFTGYCESSIWSFSITLDVTEPEVMLVLPLPLSKTNQTTLELAWSTDYFTLVDLEFQIYLDVNPIPLRLYATVENTFKLTVDNLEENVVHYWTVVPVYKNIYGTCLSGIWSFEINETYLQTFDISLDVNETERSINWGSMWSGYLELSNHGNGVELIEFTMYAGALEGLVNVTVGTFLLQPFETMNMTINITIPDGFPVRSYNIILQALSKVSKQRETFVLIINTVGTEEYYKGFETYDAPSDGKPGDDTLLSEEIPILMRNILLIGFALVITVALTILLIVRHSINRANERAIVKLKYLIARRRKEIIEARKAEQAKSAAAPLPVPQPVGQPAVPPKPAAAAPPATQPALQPTPEQPAPQQPPIAQQAPPAQPEQPATDAGSAEQPMAVTAPSEPAAPQPGKQPPGGTNEGG